ncbi:hypothetical protein [Streptomyces xanthochromogenes]|uniref:hypothetical protein n=1 Tax=Streptomyces xanthochromogenes TaxID=67384 RepID=UPI0016730E90|nr:hypothetical protein [Streptomyces xanthochromogenes]
MHRNMHFRITTHAHAFDVAPAQRAWRSREDALSPIYRMEQEMKKALVAFVSTLALSSALIGLAHTTPASSVTAGGTTTTAEIPSKRDLGWG